MMFFMPFVIASVFAVLSQMLHAFAFGDSIPIMHTVATFVTVFSVAAVFDFIGKRIFSGIGIAVALTIVYFLRPEFATTGIVESPMMWFIVNLATAYGAIIITMLSGAGGDKGKKMNHRMTLKDLRNF